ncbi:alpha-ketoglutarate-dependent dioxygenase AlkB [Simiduia sp. 21SJ11W-1]|uniref:alpha-ketoglutarate-dependent dioxygenase AlkB family protein n=1 Tax=Simiduia sp. 21SJ11W-1 TaxID=2909669 RepID=UPI00209D6307|nr:alpha-ketoglutarate-dependent dioxygenase AlkB [Simiduia sp. 21SJ11W-1]UTA49443.1 alpha-ketoglutarate-dependent dioxygenase AlkB [Simiduia sp. 21SJ11W-1]
MLNLKFFPEHLALSGADLYYHPSYLGAARALSLYQALESSLAWEQSEIRVYGKSHKIPRLNAWYGEPGLRYRYSGKTFSAHPWTPELAELCQGLNQALGTGFNSVLANYYRTGADAMGWHADDEPELGPRPVVACVSLGAPRDLRFRHRAGQGPSFGLRLAHGSLLLMGEGTQTHWQHSLPRRARSGARISLTFRQVTRPAHH